VVEYYVIRGFIVRKRSGKLAISSVASRREDCLKKVGDTTDAIPGCD
jgi:hypothetical protein